jgi:hypothetical protein
VRLQLGRQLVGCRAPPHSLGAGRRQKAAGTFGGAANCYTSKGCYPATSKQFDISTQKSRHRCMLRWRSWMRHRCDGIGMVPCQCVTRLQSVR